jgi:hypothetical protein
MKPSLKYKHYVYFGTSNGRFIVYDSRGTSETCDKMKIEETMHCAGIMELCFSENEDYIFTSSLDRTINMLKIDPMDLEETIL